MKPYKTNGLIWCAMFSTGKIVLEVVLQIYARVLQENIERGCGLEANVALTLPRAILAY